MINQFGVFRGRELFQTKGNIGGARNVFVKLSGIANDLVYPTFGGAIKNPFKGAAKMFAGDLCEYRTDANGVSPEIYLLKTFVVLAQTSTTIYVLRDNFKHVPFVGDTLMVAPSVIGGVGTAVKVTNVTATSHVLSGATYNVWQLTTSAALSASKDDILVEAEPLTSGNSAQKAMLVKNINAVIDCDCDFFDVPSSTFGNVGDTNFEDARYLYTPALGGLMYTSKMSPMPKCVLDLNRSNVNGWFKVNYYDMDTVNSHLIIGNAAPTTSTVGVVGALYSCVASGSEGVYVCTGVSGSNYTWVKVGTK